jgi:hypothetical protein
MWADDGAHECNPVQDRVLARARVRAGTDGLMIKAVRLITIL